MKRFLRADDTFPLFDIRLYHGQGNWVFAMITHLPPLQGHRDGLRHLYSDWRRMERWAWHDGVVGWTCATEIQNLTMQRWLHAVGAKPYEIKGPVIYFVKHLIQDPTKDASPLQTFITQQKHHLHGRAAHG